MDVDAPWNRNPHLRWFMLISADKPALDGISEGEGMFAFQIVWALERLAAAVAIER